jgi:SAM-dependent methyltransferase
MYSMQGVDPGIYAEILVQRGARVVGVDVSLKMVRLAKERLGQKAEVHLADLSQPLRFAEDDSFDLVICPLVLSYIEDLRPVYAEFHRVLRRPGLFIFSTGHPFFEYAYSKSNNYFDTERVGCTWRGFGPPVYMPSFRRSLSAEINPLIEVGFVLDRVLEPLPTEEFRESDPEEYKKLLQMPSFICFRARK